MNFYLLIRNISDGDALFLGGDDLRDHTFAYRVAEIPQFIAFGEKLQSGECSEGSFFIEAVIEKLREVNVRSDRNRPAAFYNIFAVSFCLFDILLNVTSETRADIDFLQGCSHQFVYRSSYISPSILTYALV